MNAEMLRKRRRRYSGQSPKSREGGADVQRFYGYLLGY